MARSRILTTTALALGAGFGAGGASAEDLTICWTAWDPANALVDLPKDYEAQSGNTMTSDVVPWPNFADRMLNELKSGGQLSDLMIGASQWVGGPAENGHYVKLNDFFAAESIDMGDVIDATATGSAEWSKGMANDWALPAFGDVAGWTYRKDWFSGPRSWRSSRRRKAARSPCPRPSPN